jgi:hypothetical protein
MQAWGWRGALVVGWLLGGCGDSATGDETAASTSTAGGTATTSSETTAAGTTTEGTSEEIPTTGAADSSSTAITGPGEDSSAGGDGETAGSCEPPPPAGDACLECAAANCCTAWAACQANEPCACVVDCHVVQGGSLGMCRNQCNLDTNLYQALYFCGQASCLGTCVWDCC